MPAPPLSLPGIYGSLRAPTARDLIYSVKAFAAAVLAMAVGFSQNLDNPYWSVLTVYIIVNPPGAGAIRSKGLFRLIGTVAGGVAVVCLTGLFADQIGLLVAGTIAVIVAAAYLQYIDKTPTNYIWFAIAITASVIALNNVTRPSSIFDVTTARVAEISLGILATMLIDSFWPEPMTPAFLKTMSGWRGQAREWLVGAINPVAPPLDEKRRQDIRKRLNDLIKGIGAIDGKAVQLPFDVVDNAPRGRHLDLVRRQVAMLTGDLIGIEMRAQALRDDGTLRVDLGVLLDDVTAWVDDGHDLSAADTEAHAARGEALARRLDAVSDGIDRADGGRTAWIERGLVTRLAAFVRDWQDLACALHGVESGDRLSPRLEQIARRTKPIRSIDYLGAALDLAPMAIALGVAAFIWYLTAWDSGPSALLFAFAGCVFLVGQGQILQSLGGLLVCVLIAFALVFLYQFVILPRVTDFPVLVMVLGIALVPVGVLMAMSMAGMLISALLLSFLALQTVYNADFAQTVQTLAAAMVGLLIALFSLRVFSYDRGRFATRRLAAAVRRDVIDVARSRRVPDGERFLYLALYRLSLYLTAAEKVAAGKPLPRLGLIRDLSIGNNLLVLRQCENAASAGARDAIAEIRGEAIAMLRAEQAGRPAGDALRGRVEAAIANDDVAADPARGPLLDALVGLDLALREPSRIEREAAR